MWNIFENLGECCFKKSILSKEYIRKEGAQIHSINGLLDLLKKLRQHFVLRYLLNYHIKHILQKLFVLSQKVEICHRSKGLH